MKICVCMGALLLACSGLAGEPAKAPQSKLPKDKPASAKTEVLTGSRIPQRKGEVPYQRVTVVDSKRIERSGAHDVADLLRRGGYLR